MSKKKYIVLGRIWAKRVCVVEADSSQQAIKLARKLTEKEWMVAELRMSANLSARQAVRASNPLKEQLKNEIEQLFSSDGE